MKYQQRDLIDDLTCILKKEIYICRLTGAIEMIRSGDRKSSRLIEGRRPAVPRHWEVSNTFWLAHQRKFTRVTQSSQSHNRNTVLDSQTYTKFDFKLKRHGGAPNTTLKLSWQRVLRYCVTVYRSSLCARLSDRWLVEGMMEDRW